MNKPQLLAGFAVKVLMGLLYGYVFLHYYNGDDTWKFFRASLAETELLLNDPKLFFINEFTPANALQTGKNLWEITSIYLNDLQYVIVIKSMALMNLVTGGNYYLDSVIFNAIIFFGHLWLYKLMSGLYPLKRKMFFAIIFFFLPAVFWLSGIRVDGWLFFFLSLLLYSVCGKHEWGVVRPLLILIAFAGVLICRPQVAILTAISLIAWYISNRTGRAVMVFGMVYGLALALFFASAFIVPGGGLPGVVASGQHEFSQLKGTKFKLDKLDATPISYLKVLPQAAGNTFLRPFPWEAKGFLQLITVAEVVAFWVIVIGCIYNRHVHWKLRLGQPVILLLVLLSVTTYILIGYIVPFPGAIVRYRAIPEILILCSIICISKWGENTNYKNLKY